MISTLIKSYVFDACLNFMINRIKQNLFISTEMPVVGKYFSRISHISDDEHYHNCVITGIEHKRSYTGMEYTIVYFSYVYAIGSDFEYWQEELALLDRIDNGEIDPLDLGEDEYNELDPDDDFEYDDEYEFDDDESNIELYQLYDNNVGVNMLSYMFVV